MATSSAESAGGFSESTVSSCTLPLFALRTDRQPYRAAQWLQLTAAVSEGGSRCGHCAQPCCALKPYAAVKSCLPCMLRATWRMLHRACCMLHRCVAGRAIRFGRRISADARPRLSRRQACDDAGNAPHSPCCHSSDGRAARRSIISAQSIGRTNSAVRSDSARYTRSVCV